MNNGQIQAMSKEDILIEFRASRIVLDKAKNDFELLKKSIIQIHGTAKEKESWFPADDATIFEILLRPEIIEEKKE
jgi:hypothetical protein